MKRKKLLQSTIDPTLPLPDPQEELFCELYSSDRDFMGNGVQSSIEAFNIDMNEKGAYQKALNKSQYLLRKPSICARINHYIERASFNDQFVDKQHAFIIAQHADLRTKMAGIKEYNLLKGRVKQRLELSFKDKTDKDLEEERARLEEELRQAEQEMNAIDINAIDPSKGMNPDNLSSLSEEQMLKIANPTHETIDSAVDQSI